MSTRRVLNSDKTWGGKERKKEGEVGRCRGGKPSPFSSKSDDTIEKAVNTHTNEQVKRLLRHPKGTRNKYF